MYTSRTHPHPLEMWQGGGDNHIMRPLDHNIYQGIPQSRHRIEPTSYFRPLNYKHVIWIGMKRAKSHASWGGGVHLGYICLKTFGLMLVSYWGKFQGLFLTSVYHYVWIIVFLKFYGCISADVTSTNGLFDGLVDFKSFEVNLSSCLGWDIMLIQSLQNSNLLDAPVS